MDGRETTGVYIKSPNGLKLRDERVRRLVRRVRNVMPWLEDADVAALRAWAQFEILADQCHAYIRRVGVFNEKGNIRDALAHFRLLRSAPLAYARELGMTPAARMAIHADGTTAAIDLAGIANATDVDEGQSLAPVPATEDRPAIESAEHEASTS